MYCVDEYLKLLNTGNFYRGQIFEKNVIIQPSTRIIKLAVKSDVKIGHM